MLLKLAGKGEGRAKELIVKMQQNGALHVDVKSLLTYGVLKNLEDENEQNQLFVNEMITERSDFSSLSLLLCVSLKGKDKNISVKPQLNERLLKANRFGEVKGEREKERIII